MQITFIDHSSFYVDLKNVGFLFDWYKGELPSIDVNKQLYVFSSHKHHDHFNMEIFQKLADYPNVHYVFSKDIRLSSNYLERNGVVPTVKEEITYVGKNQSYELGDGDRKILVETLTSTDAGVAFVVTYEGKVLYHAGDLNWWSWPGEEFEEENKMEREYTNEINKLKGRHLDVAFVVLDPRQEERYWWGFDYFMKVVGAEKVFPMHCWGNYSVIDLLLQKDCAKSYLDQVVPIEHVNQTFTI